MPSVGIVINPVSGTDIRRLTSYANFIDNNQKAYIASRVIKSLDSIGVNKILLMPDFYGVAQRALSLIDEPEYADIEFVDINPVGGPEDTIKAVDIMVKHRVSCIVLLGGDGTVRVASRTSRDTPLLPISTGTNNVIPYFIDGSVAGLIAGIIALNSGIARYYLIRLKRLDVIVEGIPVDYALVDVATTNYIFKGSKALIDINMIKEAVVSISSPISVGLAGVAGMIHQINPGDEIALYIKFSGANGRIVRKAIVAPGLIRKVGIDEIAIYRVNMEIPLGSALTIALDGEREIEVDPRDDIKVYVNPEGPYIVDVPRLAKATSDGYLSL